MFYSFFVCLCVRAVGANMESGGRGRLGAFMGSGLGPLISDTQRWRMLEEAFVSRCTVVNGRLPSS